LIKLFVRGSLQFKAPKGRRSNSRGRAQRAPGKQERRLGALKGRQKDIAVEDPKCAEAANFPGAFELPVVIRNSETHPHSYSRDYNVGS